MIFTERTIRVSNGTSSISSPIILYKGDKNIKIRFKIVDCPYTYSKNVDNIIETSEASYAQLIIKTPNNGSPILSDIAEPENGYVTFIMTSEMIDEAKEVGKYSLQVRLLDGEQYGRITIPEVVDGIEVREPMVTEGVSTTNEVDVAVADYAVVTAATPEEAFDSEGNYIKTNWQSGNLITAAKLNKIEDGITGVNSQIKEIANNIISSDELVFDDLDVTRTVSANVDERIIGQEYLGGYIEIQPDSWDGSVCATDSTTKTWGFPMSLLGTERNKIKNNVFSGYKGIMYIRFPLGFAYRGYRNIDETSRLARNIGERFSGQNKSLSSWFENIAKAGGGLAPEYWCPPPHWLTSGSYSGDNQISAGGSYDRTTTLASIKTTDETQYNAQIEAFTDAIVDDLEYLHTNIAPVRMFGLQNEPVYSKLNYGACKYDAQTYNDILEVLYPKIQSSSILSIYNDEENEVKLLVASSDENSPFSGIASTFITNHADMIWGYTHHSMRKASGEGSGIDTGADWYKSSEFSSIKGSKTNVFINEYEYFNSSFGTNEFKCSNNMLHLINEAVYGEAQVLHPIIHICKPLGQNLSQTNTNGYCMFAVNLKGNYGIDITSSSNTYGLNKGTYIPNTWVYNSWCMFNDNLPVGAYRVGSYSNKIPNAGWVTYKYGGKLYIFMANNTSTNASITLTFEKAMVFEGKAYSMDYCGEKIKNKQGDTITFVIPAYSGQVWISNSKELASIPCTGISLSANTLEFTTSDTQTLTATVTPEGCNDTISWSSSATSIATVSNGVVTPITNGKCIITATCGSQSATCNVTVSGIKAVKYEAGYYNDSGQLTQLEENYTTVDYIPCTPNSEVNVSINSSYRVRNFRMAYFDENKAFVSRTYGDIGDKYTDIFAIPSGAHYVKIGIVAKNTDSIEVRNIFNSLTITPNDSSNILTLTLGGINYSTGLDEVSNTKYRTDYLNVPSSKTIKIICDKFNNGPGGVGIVIRGYDDNNNFVGNIQQKLATESQFNVTVTNGATKFRIVFANANGSDTLPNMVQGDIITINGARYTIAIS